MDTNLQKYLSFVQTAHYGSFTKAAQYLNYSQSSVSRMIIDLENEWKLTLFERSAGGVKLTSDGTALLPYAESVIREFEKLQMQVDNLNGLDSGLVRIGTISSIAAYRLPDMIAEFRKEYPNVRFELLTGHYGDIEKRIIDGSVDCGFLRLPTTANLQTKFLERDRLLAVMPVGHPLADYKKFPSAALGEYPFMLLEREEKSDISEIFDRCKIQPNICIRTVDDYAIMSMVEKGLGISILPELILKRTPYRLITKELDITAYRSLGVAVKDKRTLKLKEKIWFIRHICVLQYFAFKEGEKMDNKFYIAVKALIFHSGKFLLIKRSEKARGDYYYWEFPGGRLEFGESPDDALSREIMEETGLQAKTLCPVNTWSFFKDENTEVIGITFLCETDTDSVALSKEHDEYVWITYDNLDKYNVIPSIINDMKKVDMNEIYSKLNRGFN